MGKRTGRPRGRPPGSGKKADRALLWIRALLTGGDRPATDIQRIVSDAKLGFGWATLRLAKVRFGIHSYRLTNDGPWFWTLKTPAEIAEQHKKQSEEQKKQFEEQLQAQILKNQQQFAEEEDKRRRTKFEQHATDFEAQYAEFKAGRLTYLGNLIWLGQQLLAEAPKFSDRLADSPSWRMMLAEAESARRAQDEVRRSKQPQPSPFRRPDWFNDMLQRGIFETYKRSTDDEKLKELITRAHNLCVEDNDLRADEINLPPSSVKRREKIEKRRQEIQAELTRMAEQSKGDSK